MTLNQAVILINNEMEKTKNSETRENLCAAKKEILSVLFSYQ